LFHYYTFISKEYFEEIEVTSSWKLRDIAVSYGGEAILFLNIDKQKQLVFPEEDINLKNFYPELQNYFEKRAKRFLNPLNQLLIVGANTIEVARKSAIISSLNISKKIIDSIHEKI